MEFPNPSYTTFTIPTGATSGQRITFNELGDGKIRVYDHNGNLVDYIGGTSGEITSENFTNYISFAFATLWLGGLSDISTKNTSGFLDITSQGDEGPDIIRLQSPVSDALHFPVPLQQQLRSGSTGTRPTRRLADPTGTQPVKDQISGYSEYITVGGSTPGWVNPTYQTGYAGLTSFTGVTPVQSLQFRITTEDECWLYGAFQITAAGTAAVPFQLPAGYYDTTMQSGFLLMERPAAGLPMVLGFGYVSTAGNFHVDVGAGFSRNVGDTFYVNAHIPLGNQS